jgi:Ca2+-binding RTX toxin-like protein
MAEGEDQGIYNHVGTEGDDTITEGQDAPTKINGNAGSDSITSGDGNDLGAGDMVGSEWTFVDGRWVFNPEALVNSGWGAEWSFNDVIRTGAGDDVLLGNGGHDSLFGEQGDDLVNAGKGHDLAYGGAGHDKLNLEAGDDYGEGGVGNDTVNAGSGNDVVYGDVRGDNLLANDGETHTSFSQHAAGGGWTMSDSDGAAVISQSANTQVGQDYTISFELAANIGCGHGGGIVEVLWDGEVVDTIEVVSGVYETHQVGVTSQGDAGDLSFRIAETYGENADYDFSGPITSYESEIPVGDGDTATVQAFAPGQASLYQVIDGQLNVFDVEAREYIAVGDNPGFKINAVGFNAENDMIYGVAKSNGTDSLGNPVKSTDIVAVDAKGDTYRIGDGVYGDYVGDFDDSGNLWTFHTSLNRISVVDVDNLDADGNPETIHYDLPNGIFNDRTYDLAYNSEDDCFYAVVSPGSNGGAGKVVRIDLSEVPKGGDPRFSELPIVGTEYEDGMETGLAKGAYGAVFLDGDGNLYFGLNKGDHDLDASTGAQGGIYRVNADWEAGQAYAEFMSEAPSTGSNDGAVDPRSADAFSEVDAGAAVLLRNPELTAAEGGNDKLRGGSGNDELHGNGGNDTLQGGKDEDTLFGDSGNDKLYGNSGDDVVSGGTGDDRVLGQTGHDSLMGDGGKDYLNGGGGSDTLSGGTGDDKLVGGKGQDVIMGGAGNDHMWGGNWSGDNAQDSFVVSAGGGRDYIHDFELDHDQIDLSSYGLDYDQLQSAMSEAQGSVVIDLSGFSGGQAGDKLVIKSVSTEDLDESNFIL